MNESVFKAIKEEILIKYNETNKGNDLEIEIENILVTLTNTHNQKYNFYENKTNINLGDCENELIKAYNIPDNASLYIFKIEVKEEGMKIPKIEYEVYYPLYDNNLIKLNLTLCKNSKIDITIPVSLNDNNIDKYNLSSGFYNNICYRVTSKYNTDIALPDRKNEFIENNMTLCEEDCNLVEYNYTTQKAKCSCLIKLYLPLIEDIKFDKDKLYKSFTDIKNIANYKFLKCYKDVFIQKSLIKNCSFYILLFLLIFYFVTLFLFYYKYISTLINDIKDILNAKKYILNLNKKKCKNNISNIIHDENRKNSMKKISIQERRNIKTKKHKDIIFSFPPRKRNSIKLFNISHTKKSLAKIISFNKKRNTLEEIAKKDNEEKKYKNILNYTEYELNNLSYERALIIDKRTFSQYYLSLLKSGHLLFFSFYSNNKDYNVYVIKIFLLFFFFEVYLTINTVFFDDNTMHKIYIDKGHFNLIYQIPQIIYSYIISTVITLIIKYLSLSQKSIVKMKQESDDENLDSKYNELIKELRLKFVIFFIISFFILITFGYYNICFCGIYENTQMHLIKDTLISFILSLLYPFGIYLIPSIFRINALQDKNRDKNCLYKFSELIQNI